MEINQIITLIQAVSEYSLTGFFLEEGNIKLKLEKTVNGSMITEESTEINKGEEVKCQEVTNIETSLEPQAEIKKEEPVLKGELVTSPLVGTFYVSASPESEPFVKVGDIVKKGQVLGIIEAMKLMNEIEAEKDGVIEAIFVENEQMVEYGKPLFSIL